MKLLLIAGLAISFILAQTCVADDYSWVGGPTGDFSSTTDWLDITTGQNHVGPPGGGDNADIGSIEITLDSGSVMDLSGESGTLDVTGSFSASTLSGTVTVEGAGQLSVGTLTAFADINGGNVSANEVSTIEMEVDGGSVLTVSGSFRDPRYLECSGTGSMITANGGMTDVGLVLNAGGQVTAASIENLLGSSCSLQGSGALVTVTGNFGLAEGATLDVSSNATLQVNGNLDLDGGTNVADGGCGFSDPGTTATVSGVLTIGKSKGSFYLTVENGAQLTSGVAHIGAAGSKLGYATLSDSNTLWTVQAVGLSVGDGSTGQLMINSGAELDMGNSTALAIGLFSGSSGTLVVDGAGSHINASGAYTSIGLDSGSQGMMQIQNQATMTAGADFYVGDGGFGTLNLSSAQLTVTGATTKFGIGHQANANGSMTISGGATLTIQGPTTVGDAGVGTLSLGGSIVRTDGTIVGNTNGSTGTAYITGTNSYWIETNQFIVGSRTSSKGNVYVRARGSLQITGDSYIGGSGNGSLYIQSGGNCFLGSNGNQHLAIGNAAGGVGLLSISDSNSVLNANTLFIVGVSGNGTVVVSNGASAHSDILELGAVTNSAGTVSITGPGSTWVAGNNVNVGGTRTSQPAGNGHLLVQNSGTLRAYPLLYVSPSGVVTLDSTGQIAVGTGAFGAPGTLRVSSGGKLYGKGLIQGQVVVGAGGVFIPGDSPGIFTIDGNLQEEAGGEMDIFIGGSSPGSGYSQISVSGTASIGGTLNVILTNGFTPAPGQSFGILNAAAMSGTFSKINGASISYGSTGVTLSNVTGVTNAPQLSVQNEGGSVVVTWPETAQGYTLQTSSDLSTNGWFTVAPDENTYVAPSGTSQGFFRLIR